MAQQAILITHRLRLVPLSDEHIDYEAELDADPDVVRFVGNGHPRTRAEVERLHRGRMARGSSAHHRLGFWVGFLQRPDPPAPAGGTGDGDFVGWWVLEVPQRRDQGLDVGQAEIGYRLMKRFWRQGLAKEGARELIRHGFEDLGLQRIFAETMAVNKASRATMASVGLSYVKTFYQHFDEPIPGSDEGEVEYAITLGEWQALQQQT